MSRSVLYMSMSLDGYIAGPNDQPGNPGGDDFMRLHEWYGFAADAGPSEETIDSAGTMPSSKVGCTVQLLEPGITDGGPIIVQRAVPVREDDTAESLRELGLLEEHLIAG